MVASKVDENGIAIMGALVASACLSLFFASYPMGRIFMGDAGVLHRFYNCVATNNFARSTSELSAWSLLALVFWPVMDTLFFNNS